MDKYEFKLSLNEINTLIGERRFEEAAQIADGIDWNHVKSPDTLCRVSEIYKAIGEYNKSRDVMAIAHERDAENPKIIYALCELTIFLYGRDGLQSDLTLSLQLMQEYKAAEPDNPKRLILQYKMYGVSPVSAQEKISVLEQLQHEKFFPRWAYELAGLYAKEGSSDKAAAVCREILQKAPDGNYAGRAQELLNGLPEAARGQNAAAPKVHDGDMPETPRTQAGDMPGTPGMQAGDMLENQGTQDVDAPGIPEAEDAGMSSPESYKSSELSEPAGETFPGASYGQEPGQGSRMQEPNTQETPAEEAFAESAPAENMFAKETEIPTESSISISEVMEEWEKIRSDIRRSNDEKRAQRILDDTGTLWRDFDETARHGLLEDIEKGVARQRRQVRSGMYRMGEAAARDAYPEERLSGAPSERTADRRSVRRTDEAQESERQPVRRAEEPQMTERRPVRRAEAPQMTDQRPVRRSVEREEAKAPAPERRQMHAGMQERRQRLSAGAGNPGNRAIPISNEDDDVRVYGSRDDVDELATRRWNSEEIHRAMARQEREALAAEMENAGEKRRMQEEYLEAQEPEEAASQQGAEISEQEAEGMYQDIPFEADIPVKEDIPAEAELPEEEEAVRGDVPAETDLPEKEEAADTDLPDEAPAFAEEEAAEADAPMPDESEAAKPETAESEAEDSEAAEPDSAESEIAESEPAGSENVKPKGRRRQANAEAVQEPSKEGTKPARKAAPAQRPARKNRELSKEERRLFGPFCRMRENVEQLTEALDQVSLASSTGNVLIIGNEATAERVAKGILEVTRHADANFTGKIAKVNGSALNKLSAEGLAKTFVKLSNGALIISRATELSPKAAEQLYHELEGKDHGLIVIMADGSKKMEQFRHENERFLGSFTAVINIRPLNDKALVAYARDYAVSQDYSIDEFGQLALAQRIAMMQTSTHQVTLKEVRDLVDEAIDSASKVSALKRLFSRNRFDENDRIILHEKDFAQS